MSGDDLAVDGQAQRAALLAALDALYATWMEKAETGDAAAAAIVLAICKQRAALLGLARSPSPALRVAATAGAGTADEEKPEVKVVVEYVNDWREVLRRRA